jgi:hypothetical protein
MKRIITLIGVALAILGFYGPWVTSQRQIAALTYNALDLAEFSKFLVRAHLGEITREIFLVPIVAAALALALWTSHPNQISRVLRYALSLAAAGLSLVPLPPYPYLLTAYSSAEDRGSFWLSVAGLVGVALMFMLGQRIAGRWRSLIFFLLALISALPATWEFFARALPAISQAYGSPALPAWGFWATMMGLLLVATGGWVEHVEREAISDTR